MDMWQKGESYDSVHQYKMPALSEGRKRDWIEKQIGVTKKQGTCKYNYCKIGKKKKFF